VPQPIAKEVESKASNLTGVIAAVRQLANAAAAHERTVISIGAIKIVFDGRRLGDDRGPLLSDGKLRDVMADTAAADLADAEPWQICRCRESECQKLFLAARKGQIYCSHNCANAAASREYRATHANERAAREKSRYRQKKLAGTEEPKEA
jgi:hypothetical protein